MPDDEKENVEVVVPENKWILDSLAQGFQLFKTALDFFYNTDPSRCQHRMNKPFRICKRKKVSFTHAQVKTAAQDTQSSQRRERFGEGISDVGLFTFFT